MKKISQNQLSIMIQTIKKKYPNRDKDFYKMFLSVELLRIYLGNAWVNVAVFDKNIEGHNKHLEAIKFLKSSLKGFQWQERVRRLAERIYNLQNIKNIEIVIEEIKQGNFESRFAEIEGATHFYRAKIPFEFINPIGKKGKDFDIKIITDPPINCDVKHKLEDIKRNKKIIVKSIKKTLRKARQQVPFREVSLFLIKIPEAWDKKDKYIVNALEEFFKEEKSKNVLAVILRWEERDKKNKGIFYWKYSLRRNENFSIEEKTKDILESLNKTSYDNWINFDLLF